MHSSLVLTNFSAFSCKSKFLSFSCFLLLLQPSLFLLQPSLFLLQPSLLLLFHFMKFLLEDPGAPRSHLVLWLGNLCFQDLNLIFFCGLWSGRRRFPQVRTGGRILVGFILSTWFIFFAVIIKISPFLRSMWKRRLTYNQVELQMVEL